MLLNTFISNNAPGSAAGGGPATFSDNFNRTENPLSDGGAWTVLTSGDFAGSMQTVATVAMGVAHSGQDVAAYVNSPSFAADQKTTLTLTATVTDGPSAGVRFNSGTGEGYMVHVVDSTNVTLYKMPGYNSLANWSVTALSAGVTLGLGASGTGTTTLSLYRNGTATGDTYNDSSSPVTSGQPWMHIFDYAAIPTIDQFDATDL